ncbi:Predicted dithiol-disulfide isomerase, DsbA family [Paracoccus isoporae]|uniref:Predicted dithiol-disulfide isomerase, DsbA family n=1 Tax=Paracoccus isoporae TaxID=591205 RepID=A0A1G6XN77_9RHOB|nr:DsbA family oxidoreductase [Paracoccus isoporae]SDD79441.1 Predicted dithiol-disulfide isomerase, DsbA family [Paracoccus isoporae]
MTTLDIFADPTCPWCLIGKAELDQALETRPDHPFGITWHPFRLNPDLPADGVDHVDYMKAKFRDEAGILDANAPVLKAAERLGLWINMAAIKRVPPTLDAFRLLHWAGIEGAQTRVMSALLRVHWREGRDIADHAELARIGQGAGMDADMIRRLLASDADRDEVLTREDHARERGIRAVPTFVLGNAHVVSGAQPADLWRQVIDELAASPDAG